MDINDSSTVFIQQRRFSEYEGEYINLNPNETNTLLFQVTQGDMGNGTTIFQEYIPTTNANIPDPNAETFPPYWIEEGIKEGNGVFGVPLKRQINKVLSGGASHCGLMQKKVSRVDYNNDGKVDMIDYAIWAKDYGKAGNSQSDLAGIFTNTDGQTEIKMLPDGIVDYRDLEVFCNYLSQDMRRRGVYEGGAVEESGVGVCEGFENGRFDEAHWVNYGGWSVTSEKAHGGACSMRCDENGGSLKWSGFLAGGEVSFWAYIGRGGSLKFSINGIIEHEHAGGEQWERVAAPVGQGTNNLRWEGYGPLFIDDVCVPQQ